jgi:hypothetical protein
VNYIGIFFEEFDIEIKNKTKSDDEIKMTKIALMASLANFSEEILKYEDVSDLVEPILKNFVLKELTGKEKFSAC